MLMFGFHFFIKATLLSARECKETKAELWGLWSKQ